MLPGRVAMVAVLFLCLGLVSCSESSIRPSVDFEVRPRLSRAGSALVAFPLDWRGEKRSGEIVGNLTLRAFQRQLVKVEPAPKTLSKEELLAAARERHLTYLVVPSIRYWVDHWTMWSKRVDRAAIEISIYEVSSGPRVDQVTIDTSGVYLFTAIPFAIHSPEDGLPDPIQEYAASLFHR